MTEDEIFFRTYRGFGYSDEILLRAREVYKDAIKSDVGVILAFARLLKRIEDYANKTGGNQRFRSYTGDE